MRIALINSDWHNEYRQKNNRMGGVGYYRLWLPKLGLESITDWEVDFWGSDILDKIKGDTDDEITASYVSFFNEYDVVVLKHFDNTNAARFIFFASEYTNTPIITDLDDNVLEVREDQPAYDMGYKKGELKRATVATLLSFSKAIFATNEFLGKEITNFIKESCNEAIPYYVLPNYSNKSEWEKYTSKTNKDKVVIGWHGSLTHYADIKLLEDVLPRVMSENKNVYLELIGGVDEAMARKIFLNWDSSVLNRVKIKAGTQSWWNFPYYLMKQRWDIGIAPLIDDKFNKSKSNIKWLEFSYKSIPCVASDVLPYKTIEHARTGFLCKNEDDWYKYLTMLIKDKKLRSVIGKNANKEIIKNWQIYDHAYKWRDAILAVLKSNKKKPKTLK